MKKVLLTALALLMGTFMYAQRDAAKIPGASPSKDVKTEAVLSAVKAPANTNSMRTAKSVSQLTYNSTTVFDGSIGTGGTGTYYEWAAVFRPSMYSANDNYVTSVDFYSYQAATYTVSIYEGEREASVPTELIYQHQYNVTDANQWVTLSVVNSVVTIDQTKSLWVAVGTDQVAYPACYSAEVLSTTDCCMMYFGDEWMPVTELGITTIAPWMIVANTTSENPGVQCEVISTFPYFNDFENFMDEKDCWVSIDNDGDGQDWITGTTQSGQFNGYNNSTGLVSKSYDYDGASASYHADNYLLSPEFVLPADYMVTLSWYAKSAYSSFPDHYEVMIAPNGSTSINDFVSVFNENGPSDWTQRSADISAYAGTTVRVVFHHQDYDKYWILIDNLGIETTFDCSGGYGFPFVENFENGLDCWGNFDEDGDGNTWQLAAGNQGNGAKSASWGSSIGSLTPDNWLVSPEITIPSGLDEVTLAWKVKGGSASYREHYGVYVSTTGDEPSYFTTQIYDGQSPASTAWTDVTVDMTAYAGQTIRIAFRHYNSSDMWDFTIDEISITSPLPCTDITEFPYFNDFNNFLDEKDCWIDIDNDGDGFGWFTDTEAYGTQGWGVEGLNCLVSQSYDNNIGARDADNYLLSPEVVFPANSTVTLSWYEQSQDASYPDSYEVMIAPNGSTEISDFVSIYSGVAANPWTERTADLSAYAGTTVRVVFHHESSDCYILEIDNMGITVEVGPEPSGELTIYADATETQRYTPVYTYYGDTQNSAAQFVVPASLLTDMIGSQITSMKFYTNPAQAYQIQNISGPAYAGYMTEVESETMSTFIDFNSATNIFNGNISLTDDCLIIDLATPYTYNGGNLAIAFVCTQSAGYCSVYYYSQAVTGGSIYRNSGSGATVQNYIPKTTFTYTGGGSELTVTPSDLGPRPNGAWMEPVTVEVGGGVYNVTGMDMDNDYFTFDGPRVPFTTPATFAVTTGTAATGPVEGTLTFLFNDSKNVKQFTMTATAYDPVAGDVVEMATVVSNPVGYTNTPTGIYHNYNLPGDASDGADAVYKLTFASDVMLDANVGDAEGGKVALYPEGFNGEGGPMATNNYEYNGPQVEPGAGDTFTEGFESGSIPTGWTTIDADGDGHNWTPASVLMAGYVIPFHSGADCITSESYSSTVGALTPDNYLVTPKVAITNGSTFSFWACAQDPSYASEHYGVAISTNGNTSASDFTTIAEWTMTAKEAAGAGAYMSKNGKGTREGSWYQKTVDLSAYAGQQIYIAIRHFNCSDWFYINVDDAELAIASKGVAGTREDEPMFVPAGTYYLVAQATESFTTSINVTAAPAPEPAVVLYPTDGMTNVEAPVAARWKLGNYTTEMQVLVGSQYPPQTALIDWTTELVASVVLPELEPNQSYFMQVNERNVAGTTYGEIIAFTTPIDPVEGLEIAESNLYPGDAAVLTWTANARTLKGYNVYVDGVKWNESLINTNSYDVEGLEYNMAGYDIQVSAVYDAGESELSEAVTAYMTGYGSVSGHAYDKPDEDTDAMPIAFATVMFSGSDEYGVNQTFVVETDEEGAFAGEILAGTYTASVITEGYDSNIAVNALVTYNNLTDNIDIYTHEFYYPVGMVTATEEGDEVLVEWSWDPAELMIDFETGDFSQAEFTLPASYPWEITTTNPYEGTYCMKSTCEGVASGISAIEVTVDVPYDGLMGFWVKVSSEQNYDKFHFYIDGVEMGSGLSGQAEYAYKEYAVTEGTHTYKWEYAKDSSVNSNDDCIYVDNVTLYKQAGPAPSGMTYNFDDGTMMGWTTIDANNDGYDWVLGSQIGGVYLVAGASLAGSGHNSSADLVCSGSYSNASGVAITPDNYLVSPTKISAQDGAAINFWACAQDASYAAEHFGVAVSTGSNTAAADFTMLQEWTMTAKNAPAEDKAGRVRGGEAKDQGSWYEYTVDLSAYAGQEIWVAIRHFNCNDQFILNVDDITLGDGSEAVAPRNDRTFQSFNVYRRNNVDAASVADPELIVEGTTEFAYTDAAWATLEFGEWQWGIAATYDGYAPVPENRTRETATFGFEGGSLEGWTGIKVNTDGGEWINSDDNLGGYDYTTLAHSGTGFAMCYSFVDYVGSFDTDAYLVSPQKYSIDASSSIAFWADNANDDYPEDFSVCVSTAENPTAADFVQIWNGGAKGTNAEKAAVRHNGTRYENWRSHEISLAAYAGQEIWIAFHDVNYDMYEIWIDDVTITYAGGAPVPPTPGPTGSGISEIIWSNVIDKDMEATLTFNVSLNNGQSPEGATIAVVGENNTYNETVDETGVAEMIVRKGDNYTITVALEGYASYTATEFVEEDEYEYNVVLQEVIAPVAGLYVSPTGWAMWEGGTAGPTPGPTPGQDVTYSFEEDFVAQELLEWTTIDANNDGYDWYVRPTGLTTLGHTGEGFVTSFSYDGSTGVTPDNYLVSPEKAQYTQVSFWAQAQDAAYPAEKFGVAVSTGSNTNASDFTTLQSWVMTAKSTGAKMERGMNTTGTWYEYTVDLSAYAGQEIWVAIRHFDCYDQFRLNVDDITLSTGSRGDRAALSYKVMLDGTYIGETTNPFYQLPVEGMEEGSVHVTSVAPLYTAGMGEWMTYEWTYTSCSNFAGVTDFTSAVDNNTVTLNWTLPGGGSGGSASTFTEDFENGLNWNVLTILADGGSWIHSDDNLGGYDYTTLAHSGTGFAMCYSFVDYVGSFNTDSYMYTTEKYNISNGSTLSFWADNANDSYPENFSVVISTVDNPTSAADFTQVWSGGAKGTGSNGAAVRRSDNRYENWRSHSIDLSAYAGQTVYIGFHDVNYDMYEIWIDDVELTAGKGGRTVLYEPHFVTDPGAMANGADASWIKNGQSTWGPNCNNGGGYKMADDFTLAAASTINEIEVYGYQTGSTTTSTFTGLYAQIYDGAPNAGGQVVWGDAASNIMTATSFTNCYRGSDGETTATTRPIMAVTATGLNIELEAGTYYLVWSLAGSASSGPWAVPEALPGEGNTGNGLQQDTSGWAALTDSGSGTPYGLAFKLVGEGGGPVPPTPGEGIIGAVLFRDGEFVGMFGANTTTYTEELEEAGQYTYTIRVIYDGDPDVTYYAMSCGDDETVTIIDAVEDNDEVISSIYPNPTRGDLYITATAMKHVTVFNTMGQVVFSSDVNTDSYVLNMGQLEAGVYMVKVDAAQGSSVKRIAVVK